MNIPTSSRLAVPRIISASAKPFGHFCNNIHFAEARQKSPLTANAVTAYASATIDLDRRLIDLHTRRCRASAHHGRCPSPRIRLERVGGYSAKWLDIPARGRTHPRHRRKTRPSGHPATRNHARGRDGRRYPIRACLSSHKPVRRVGEASTTRKRQSLNATKCHSRSQWSWTQGSWYAASSKPD